MKKKIAIAYMRCSTDRQDCSVGDQWDSIQKWANQNKYVIIRKYSDDGISGAKASKRPGFMQMVTDISMGDFDAVLIWDSFRFARNLIEFLTYKQMFKDNGIRVIAITEPHLEEDNDAQLYIDALNGASGEMYLRKLSKDVTRALISKAERGEYAGFAPYGYTKPKYEKTLYINEAESKIVRYVYQSFLDGQSYIQISNHLSERGIMTRNGLPFNVRCVRRMLILPVYKGWYTTTIKGNTITRKAVNIPESIIDEDTWDAVHAIIEKIKVKYKHTTYSSSRKHWLSTHLRCAYCGYPYVYVSREKPRFRCQGHTIGVCPTSHSLSVDLIESLVFEKINKIYDSPIEIVQKSITSSVPSDIVDYDSEISKIEASLTRAKKAYLANIDTLEEYGDNKAKLTAQLEDIKYKKAASEKIIPININDFRSRLMNAITVLSSDGPMEEKMAVCDALIDRVIIDSNKKTLDIFFYY